MPKATWVAMRPDGEMGAVGTGDGRVLLVGPDDGTVLGTLKRSGWVARVFWTVDGAHLLVGDLAGSVGVYSADGKVHHLDRETGHGGLRDMCVSPTRPAHLVTGGKDGRLRVWQFDTAQMACQWEAGDGQNWTTAVAFAGDRVIAGKETGGIEVFRGPNPAEEVVAGNVMPWEISAVCTSPDGKWAVYGGLKGSIRVTETDGEWLYEKTWKRTPPKPIAVNSLVFAPDGSRFLAACSDGAGRVFTWPDDGGLPDELGTPFWARRNKPAWSEREIVSCACFHPSAQRIYTTHFDGSLRVWPVGPRRPRYDRLLQIPAV